MRSHSWQELTRLDTYDLPMSVDVGTFLTRLRLEVLAELPMVEEVRLVSHPGAFALSLEVRIPPGFIVEFKR